MLGCPFGGEGEGVGEEWKGFEEGRGDSFRVGERLGDPFAVCGSWSVGLCDVELGVKLEEEEDEP